MSDEVNDQQRSSWSGRKMPSELDISVRLQE